jgi:lipopolysaccharide assembly LptE-like protein
MKKRLLCVSASLCHLVLTGCGYHVGSNTSLLPKTIKTIAVPAFGNATTEPKLPMLLTSEIIRQFISRTRYTVIHDPAQADAVLSGAVVNIYKSPTVYDPVKGLTGVQMSVILQLSLTERSTGAVLFTRPAMEFRERYEIATDPQAYFDESETSLGRLSRDVARSVVTAILQNF